MSNYLTLGILNQKKKREKFKPFIKKLKILNNNYTLNVIEINSTNKLSHKSLEA